MTKVELIPYHSQGKKLVAQLEEVKIIQDRGGTNAKTNALFGLAASLIVAEGESQSIVVIGRR